LSALTTIADRRKCVGVLSRRCARRVRVSPRVCVRDRSRGANAADCTQGAEPRS
jgi:hypothetical protein